MSPRTAFLAVLLPWRVAAASQEDAGPPAPLPTDGATLDRAAFVSRVLEVNPEIEMARQAVAAAEARVPMAGAYPEPVVTATLAPASWLPGGPPAGGALRVEQMVPISSERSLMRAAARAEAAAAAEDVRGVRIELALMASELYEDWWLAEAALDVNARHAALVDELGESARARYTVGRAPQSAPLTAELERAMLDRDRLMLASARDVTVARMNALLHAPPDAPLPGGAPAAPSAGEGAELPGPAGAPGGDLTGRPDLVALERAAAAADLRADAGRAAWTPELMLMGEYSSMWMEPEHRVMVGAGVQVPLNASARRGMIAEAEAEAAMLRAERARALDVAGLQAAEAARSAEAARAAWALSTGRLLPIARERLEAARIAFQADAADFLDLIEAERALLEIELEALRSAAEHHRMQAAHAAALGLLPGGVE